jgi:hypothetical protein
MIYFCWTIILLLIKKGHGIKAGYIYRYSYFYQIIIIPGQYNIFMLSFILLYAL